MQKIEAGTITILVTTLHRLRAASALPLAATGGGCWCVISTWLCEGMVTAGVCGLAASPGCGQLAVMAATLDSFTADGRVVISFPESAVPPQEREAFIAFLKAEWSARQSRFTDADAKVLAEEVDSVWWSRNRERILRSIGTA